jgi:hypothetical protein
MADQRQRAGAWHGHTLRPLPSGESWFSGGERPPTIASQPIYRHDVLDEPFDDGWWFGEPTVATAPSTTGSEPAIPASARRTAVLLILVIVGSIVTIVFARQSGGPAEPAALPTPPSHVITSVSRTHATTASIRVGEYLDFRLPNGRTYSTVLEQPASQVPVVEALTLPGQQPELRADSAGLAVIEVMSSPVCTNPDGCGYPRTLVGTVELTVTP